jgi:hypothetical protein
MTRKLWLGFLFLAGSSVAQTQVRPQLQKKISSPQLVTAREGKDIVNAAWERDQQPGRKPDCSHLAHEVYARAGYPYPYARSVDLYIGIGSFVRVKRPQPGDLVVWRGHVGIVIDPAEHSFYSSVRSGLRTEFYDAPEWKTRGPARFYRYAAVKSANLVLMGRTSGKTRRNAKSIIAAPAVDDSPEHLPDSTHSATKSPDVSNSTDTGTESPASRAESESRGEPSH